MFERGRLYRRNELHHAWDGATRVQQQGGILTPVEAPLVLVVTGEEGGQYGYEDEWDADGVFHYFGAGQVGDMVFLRGNLALRDHSNSGEEVHFGNVPVESALGGRGRQCGRRSRSTRVTGSYERSLMPFSCRPASHELARSNIDRPCLARGLFDGRRGLEWMGRTARSSMLMRLVNLGRPPHPRASRPVSIGTGSPLQLRSVQVRRVR